MPQYRYAYDGNQEIVDVLELPSNRDELSDRYICLGCDRPLVAKTRNEHKEKHFAHKARLACNEETYLHRLAKLTFYDTYRACLQNNEPFFIEITYPKICRKHEDIVGHSCNVGSMRKTHDLTVYYDAIKIEKRDNEFIPDLLIYSNADPTRKLYVEIAVTHFLSDSKIQSDRRIIEIPIETEADIEKIKSKKLSENTASFLNFDWRSASITDSECSCGLKKYYYFIVYDSGKCIMDDATVREIEVKFGRVKNSVKYIKLRTFSDSEHIERGDLFKSFVVEAIKRGFPIRNCFLCKMAGTNFNLFSGDSIFCKKNRVGCNSNAGAECKNFWILDEYREYSKRV